MKRTDCHRPGAIVPANYCYVTSYNLSGEGRPAYGVNCEIDRRREVLGADGRKLLVNGEHAEGGRCCVLKLQATQKFADTGSIGKCSVCGSHFVYGDVWVHEPTGEYIHIGQICAPKYEMLADRSAYELARDRHEKAVGTELVKSRNAEQRAAFLASNPGLEEALKTNHAIVQDISERFVQYRTLSEKQVALVMKIAADVKRPESEKPVEERKVPAPTPTGRFTFRGKVVSVKVMNGNYGLTTKIVVKIPTENGSWLAWGTAPAAILDAAKGVLQGTEVEITATLKPGRESHFAVMERPAGKIVA